MKQILLKTVMLMFALMCSVGMWADEYSFTIQTSDFNTTSYAANNGSHDFTATCTTDANKTMTVACTTNQVYQNSNNMQWQKNNAYIYNTTDLGTIKSVTVNSSAGTFTTNYGTTEHPTSGTTVGNGYFTVKVGGATGTTSSIVVVFEKSNGGDPAEPVDAKWSVSPASVSVNATKTATATITSNYDGTLSVSSDNTGVATATINGKVITVTGVAEGSTTLSVKGAATSAYNAISKTIEVTVTQALPATLPFEFDNGKDAISTTQGMSQKGLGTDYASSPKLKFDSADDYVIINFNESAKNVKYTLKGNSLGGTYSFEVQESADGTNYTTKTRYTSITDGVQTTTLSSESRYVKFVYITKANGNVALGNISITPASAKDKPSLKFEKDTYRFFDNSDNKQVSATSSAGSTGAITYSLTEGDALAFSIDANTGLITCTTPGTYTVRADIAETNDHLSGNTTCTVKINEHIVGNSIIVAEVNDSYYAMTNTCNTSYFGYTSIQKIGTKYLITGDLDGILFKTTTVDGNTTIQNPSDGSYVQATAAKNISYTDSEYKWTNDGEKLTASTTSYGSLQYNTSNPRFTTFAAKTGQYATIVSLDDVVEGTNISISAAGYSTYYNSETAYTMPEGLTGCVVTWNDATNTIDVDEYYASGEAVPAGEPLVLKGEEGKYTLVYTTTGNNTLKSSGENILDGTNVAESVSSGDAELDAEYYFYGLSLNSSSEVNSVGFYWMAADGAPFVNGAHKAYLALEKDKFADASAPARFVFGDTETTIKSISTMEDGVIYNIAGQRVGNNYKGIVIKNGKKYLNK